MPLVSLSPLPSLVMSSESSACCAGVDVCGDDGASAKEETSCGELDDGDGRLLPSRGRESELGDVIVCLSSCCSEVGVSCLDWKDFIAVWAAQTDPERPFLFHWQM